MGEIAEQRDKVQKIDSDLVASNPSLNEIDPTLRQELIQTIIVLQLFQKYIQVHFLMWKHSMGIIK